MGEQERIVGVDILRILACVLVIVIHLTGAFLQTDPFWGALYNYPARLSVPLFFLLSGALVLPVREEGVFYKKAFSRLLVPFVLWSSVYALGGLFLGKRTLLFSLKKLLCIPVIPTANHLWFMYALLGLYLFAPILSPWLQEASPKQLRNFLLLWVVTLFFPYLRVFHGHFLQGMDSLHVSIFHAFAGFIGYFVAGYTLRRHMRSPQQCVKVGSAMLLAGLLVLLASGWLTFVYKLPVPVKYLTPGVALMAIGLFLLLKDLRLSHAPTRRILRDLAELSYGIYFIHVLFINKLIWPMFVKKELFPLPTAIKIPTMTLATFLFSYTIIKGLSYLPKSELLLGHPRRKT